MGPGYKAIPYNATRHHEAVVDVSEPWNNEPAYDMTETRWCIVSTDTGEVLDDAQGYGYKSARNAYAAYGYKHRDKSKDAEKAAKKWHIQEWMEGHKDFVEGMDTVVFEIMKGSWGPDCMFNAAFVKDMLKSQNLNPDFTAVELLKVWSES